MQKKQANIRLSAASLAQIAGTDSRSGYVEAVLLERRSAVAEAAAIVAADYAEALIVDLLHATHGWLDLWHHGVTVEAIGELADVPMPVAEDRAGMAAPIVVVLRELHAGNLALADRLGVRDHLLSVMVGRS